MKLDERPVTEGMLALEATEGETSAFLELIERYKAEVRFLISRTIGEERVEPVFLEVWPNVAKSLSRFNPGKQDLRNWILAVALQSALDRLKSEGVRGPVETYRIPDECPPGVPLKGDYLTSFISAEVAGLTVKDRTVLALSGIRGLTRKDISEISKIKLEEVKHRLSKCRKRLADKLRAHLGRGQYYHCKDVKTCREAKYCLEAEPMFEKMIDSELDWIEKLTLISHLKKCRRCRMTLTDLSDVVTALKLPEIYIVSPGLVEAALESFADASIT